METCRICQASLDPQAAERSPYPTKHKQGRPESVLICPSCGVGRADPFISQAEIDAQFDWSAHWTGGEQPVIRDKFYPSPAALSQARFDLVSKFFSKPQKDMNILDVGAGQGFFGITAARTLGDKLTRYAFVEGSTAMREGICEAWEHYRLQGVCDAYAQLDEVDGAFEIVGLSHILEHIHNPIEFLNVCWSKVQVGGLMFIDVPHNDYTFKEDVFPHLYFYSPQSLSTLCAALPGGEVLVSSAWGRSRSVSLMRSKKITWLYMLEKLYAYSERFLSPAFRKYALSWLRWANVENVDGVWVRLIIRKTASEDRMV